MRILSVTLRDYRGIEDRTIGFAPTGVTIVEGPNEIGKSSIAEAIDHVIEDLDSSGRKQIQAVKPVDRDVGPEVAIEVESGEYAFRYRKRFLRQPQTELQVHRPRPEQHTGRAAHDRVREILAATVDMALWKALRVQQGDVVGQAPLADQTSLSAALDRSAGEVPAGDHEESLFERAHEEYLRFWTETGRHKQDEIALERSVAEARQRIERIAADIGAIEADVESSLDLSTEGRRLIELRAAQRSQVEERQTRVDALAAIESGVAAAQARHEGAKLAADVARRAVDARLAAIIALDAAREQHRLREEAVTGDAELLSGGRARVADADRALHAARAERDRARDCADAAQARLAHERDAAELAMLEERYARGRTANSVILAASADAALPVTSDVLRAIREQHQAVELARARLDAARPHVSIAAQGALQGTIDGGPLELAPGGRIERRVDHDLALDLPGVASIVITAGATVDQAGTDLAHAETRLADLLRDAGATDLADAELLQRRHEEASRTIAEQRRIGDSALGGLSPKLLAERISTLRERVAIAVAVPVPDGTPEPEAAQRELDLAERVLRETEREWEAARTALMTLEVAAGQRAAEARLAMEDLERREAALVADRAALSDEALETRALELEDAERRATAELDTSRTELARQGPDEARRLLAEAKRALELTDVETRLVQDRLLQVTTRLEEHGEDGLAEDLADAQAAKDQAEARLRRYRTSGAARKLLFDTLRQERERARRSYVEPLRREIERLGRMVFGPGFGVELDDSLSVVSRTLDGRTIPFRSLSIGAQEQIAIIARLACATIVASDGGVPLLLDDALGNSDPHRLEAMGEVLAAAGRQSQIIILTCQPARYEHVTDATIVALS